MQKPYIAFCVLAVGNAFDGISLYGPFNNGEEASEYAERHAREDDWHVVPIIEPVR